MKALTLLAISAGLILSACGSDDDARNNANVAITAENAETVAAVVATSTLGNQMPTGTEILEELSMPGGFSASPGLTSVMQKTRPLAKPEETTTLDCDTSGTVTISVNFLSQEGLAANDTVAYVFNDCVEYGETINGAFEIRLSSTPNAGMEGELSFGVVIDFNNLSTLNEGGNVVLDGTIASDISYSEMALVSETTATELTVVENGIQHTLLDYESTLNIDFSEQTFSWVVSGTIDSDELGGTVSFVTIEPFSGSGTETENPTSGVLQITGAEGGVLTLTISGFPTVTLELDEDGNGEIDAVVTTTWDELIRSL